MYVLKFSKSSQKDFKRIDRRYQSFILDSLDDFIESFSSEYESALIHTGKIKKLQGQKEELYRLKLRSYRVIYKKEDNLLIILVLNITTRENAYK